MEDQDKIPVEVRASVEANALFDALRRGDFDAAARAQNRLRELGWHISREPSKPHRRRRGVATT
jgi:hypothetical protein